MIVVDSSALIAIFEMEVEAPAFAAAIHGAERLLISAVNVHETGIVLRTRRGILAVHRMWRFLTLDNDFEIYPFDATQAREALTAFDRYGKGVNSKSRLNLSDCAAYALAKTLNAPLLFKGKDFPETDLKICL